LNYLNVTELPKTEEFIEGIYINPINNIIDYEKTMTIEAALAMKNEDENKITKEKFFSKFKNKNKENKIEEDNQDISNNQILYGNRKK